MTGPENYSEAERLLGVADDYDAANDPATATARRTEALARGPRPHGQPRHPRPPRQRRLAAGPQPTGADMTPQQISVEDAFPTFQQKVRDLFDANLLLQAQVDTQQRQITALLEENERLQKAASEPVPSGGPDLAAQPPFPGEDRG